MGLVRNLGRVGVVRSPRLWMKEVIIEARKRWAMISRRGGCCRSGDNSPIHVCFSSNAISRFSASPTVFVKSVKGSPPFLVANSRADRTAQHEAIVVLFLLLFTLTSLYFFIKMPTVKPKEPPSFHPAHDDPSDDLVFISTDGTLFRASSHKLARNR